MCRTLKHHVTCGLDATYDQAVTVNPLLDAMAGIRRSRQGGTFAPYKPLLLLWALGRAARGEPRVVSFADARKDLDELMREFGPAAAAKQASAHMPFWAAASEPLAWERLSSDPEVELGGKRPARNTIVASVSGALPEATYEAARADRDLLAGMAGQLLAMLPDSQAEDVLDRCGLDLVASRRKDQKWSRLVLTAYEQRCAVCDWDLVLDGKQVGLEAAHVWEWAKGSPNTVDNGVALCVLHHRAYDRGAIAFSDERTVLVSQDAVGVNADLVLGCVGRTVRPPQPAHPPLNTAFAALHRNSIFRAPARA